jgi:pimeloyl-ACP methyl ester carboxylesterase
LPVEKLKVWIKGEEEGVKLTVAQLQTAFGKGEPSLYVQQVEPEESADYYLEAKNGQYWIKLAMESDRPQVAPIPKNPDEAGYTEERAKLAIQRLEHIARWKNTLELKSPAASWIKPRDVKLEIVKVAADNSEMYATAAAEIAMEYDRHYDSWEKPRFFLRLTNQSNRTLYCNVINLTQSYAVALPFFTSKSSVRLERGQAIDGNRVKASIPDELWEQGVSELQDRLKLIVSTGDFDASLLEQDKLEVMASERALPPSPSDPRLQNSLNQLLVRQQHKDIEPDTEALANDWLTKEFIFTIIRPQAALGVSSQRSISLGYGVEVLPHQTLQAKASFTTVEETARNIGAVLPPILREQPGVVEPVRFSSNSRGVSGELSALELFDVEDYKAVTPEAPLKVRLDAELQSGERLLAVGFDGEFFLPLGRLGGRGNTEISLERLPKPTSSGRCLHGSIRIFFQKVISQELGLTFDSYPILAAATADAEGKVTYEKNRKIVAGKVAAAEKILLYVHGIIGDTKMMAGSGQRVMLEIEGEEKPLGDAYDLVLTFDYENLNTTIEENARLLGEKLKAAGLAPKHQKQLDIVAHSMGGLVCRWFIEKEGGDRVVERLVMVGTPNAGSPWATIQDWALASLGFALNQVSSVFWPAEMVAKLLEFMEEKERSLEQMKPNSDLLRELGKASGSSVAYTIIAGDRSLVPEAVGSQVLERLAERLFAGTLDMAFFGQPNDLAATVASMKAVEKEGVSVDNVACDHFSYFNSETGLTALAKALKPSSKGKVEKLPVKDKKKWLIGGVVLAVAIAIGGVIWWNVSKSEQNQPPEESVSWLVRSNRKARFELSIDAQCY